MEMMHLGGRDVHTRAYVAAFNLRGGMQEKKVGALWAASAVTYP